MNVNGLSLDHMRAALAVAEIGSFSGAARRFTRAQSAISYAIAELEKQLGVALFARAEGSKVKVTEAGRVLLVEMEAVVRRSAEITNLAKEISQGNEHELSITLDSLFPVELITEVLRDFEGAFPAVRVRLNIEAMGKVQADVLENKCTFGILGSLPHLPSGLLGDALLTVSRVPVASSQHPLANGRVDKRMPSRMLLDHLQILQSDRSDLTQNRDFRVYTGRTWRVSELSVKRELLIGGIGWGYMPMHLIAEDLAASRLKRIWVEELRDSNSVALIIAHRRDGSVGPAARWFKASLLATCSQHQQSQLPV